MALSLFGCSRRVVNRGVAGIPAGEACAVSTRSMGMHTHTAKSALCVEPSAVDPPET